MPRTDDSFDAWARPHLPVMQRYAARLTSLSGSPTGASTEVRVQPSS